MSRLGLDRAPVARPPAPRAPGPPGSRRVGRPETLRELRVDLDKGLEETLTPVIEAVERRYLEAVLEKTRGRIQQAARIAKISRRTLQRKLTAHQIDKADFRRPGPAKRPAPSAPESSDYAPGRADLAHATDEGSLDLET